MAEITHRHQKVIVFDFLVMKWKAKDFTCYMTKENLTDMTKNLIENRVHLVVIKVQSQISCICFVTGKAVDQIHMESTGIIYLWMGGKITVKIMMRTRWSQLSILWW